MKFSFLHVTFLILAITAFIAGCSSTPQAQVTPAPFPGITSTPAGTAVNATLLSLVLSRNEVPITVANAQSQIPDLQDPTFSEFGAIRGYTQYYIDQVTDSPSAVQLGQMIVEYPPGNATRAFALFVLKNRNADQSQYNLTWLKDPRIGDESVALTINDKTGTDKPMAMIVFRKSRYMESVVMISPSLDIDTLTRAARLAADKIPA